MGEGQDTDVDIHPAVLNPDACAVISIQSVFLFSKSPQSWPESTSSEMPCLSASETYCNWCQIWVSQNLRARFLSPRELGLDRCISRRFNVRKRGPYTPVESEQSSPNSNTIVVSQSTPHMWRNGMERAMNRHCCRRRCPRSP